MRTPRGTGPGAFTPDGCAVDLYASRSKEVAIVGDPNAADTRALVAEVHGRFLPNVVLAVGRPGTPASAEVPLLHDRPQQDGRATAYVCEQFVCQQPVTEPESLAAQLSA